MSCLSRAVDEGGGGRGGDDCGDMGAGGVAVSPDGEVSVFRPVSREFIEAELERWSGLLERLGNVDDTV